jgi:hypothetical protein
LIKLITVLLTYSELDVIGEAYNTDSRPVEAIAYGVMKEAVNPLADNPEFIKPEMVIKLPEVHLPPVPGPLEAVDEVY